jgi:hypothetical protein
MNPALIWAAIGLSLVGGKKASAEKFRMHIPYQATRPDYNIREVQKAFDKREESDLESGIENEFNINLIPPIRYAYGDKEENIKEATKKFGEHLRYIRKINPSLVKCIEGFDIYQYPDYTQGETTFGARTSPSENYIEFNQTSISSLPTVVHELVHVLEKRKHLKKVQAIAKKYGYTFGDNVTYEHKWKVYKKHDKEPQGIFQTSYQSVTFEDGTPREFFAVERESIYANEQFILDSRRAYDYKKEILDYEHKEGLLNPAEYEHALRLMRPEATLDKNTDCRQLAEEWGIPWDTVARFNGISDVEQVEKPLTLVMPLSQEITQGFIVDTFGLFVYHVIEEGDTLKIFSKKYIDTYPKATPEYIKEHNNSLRARAPISPLIREKWQEITDNPLVPGKFIQFKALERGRNSYLGDKYIPCMGDIDDGWGAYRANSPFFDKLVVLAY